MTQAQIAPSALISKSIGLPSLIVLENKESFEKAASLARKDLAGFMEASDGISALDFLSKGMSVLYIERDEKLDSRIETLFVDYAAGIASFASPKGLVSGQFDPMRASLSVIISRDALEKSYPQLLAYAGAVTSI